MLPPTRRARGHLTRHSFPAPPVRAQGELTFPGSDASPCLPRVRRLLGCPGSSAIVTLDPGRLLRSSCPASGLFSWETGQNL